MPKTLKISDDQIDTATHAVIESFALDKGAFDISDFYSLNDAIRNFVTSHPYLEVGDE